MKPAKLDMLAKHLQICSRDVYNALLSYGNYKQQKVLDYIDEDLTIPESLYLDILTIDGYIRKWVFDEERIKNEASKYIPFDTLPRVYFLFDDDVLVYIGQTMKISGRITQHTAEQKTFNKVASFRVGKSELDMIEMVNIRHYHPVYNETVVTPIEYLRHILFKL